MKSLLLALCTLSLFFVSCQKELSGPGNTVDPPVVPPVVPPTTSNWFIKFKVDGVAKEYKFEDTSAITMNTILGNRLDIQGYANEKEDDYEGLALAVYFDGQTLSPGIYTSENDMIFTVYNPNHPTIVYSAGFLLTAPPTPDTIAITKISNGEVTGTFRSTIYITETDGNGSVLNVGEDFKTITNGEFRVPLIK